MHSVGRMFGLTFWENWYVIGENEADDGLPPFKFVYYTGHTLQGNYEGEGGSESWAYRCCAVCVSSWSLRKS